MTNTFQSIMKSNDLDSNNKVDKKESFSFRTKAYGSTLAIVLFFASFTNQFLISGIFLGIMIGGVIESKCCKREAQ